MHGSGGVQHLVDRRPDVTPERLIAQLVPPPTFADVSFDTYRPDPAEPSQAAAVQSCIRFCDEAATGGAGEKKTFRERGGPGGVDAGSEAPTAFATFGELTQLAGVFGFVECIDLLAGYVLVCIDEFELDDP